MTGVIFATAREAAPFLQLAGQQRLNAGAPALYGRREHQDMVTLISGMGPEAAKIAARTAIEAYGARRLVNAGICGALLSGSPWIPGTVFAVSRVRAVGMSGCAPSWVIDCDRRAWDKLPAADLVTRAKPLFDTAQRKKLACWGALVDMEGAAIAGVAHENDLPCALIKGITDLVTEGGRADLHRRLESVSGLIADILAAELIQ